MKKLLLAVIAGVVIGIVLHFGIGVAQNVAADYYISEVIERYDGAVHDGYELKYEYVNNDGGVCTVYTHPTVRRLKYLLHDISELN